MTPDQEAILTTLAIVLTSAGAVVGAGLITAAVQFLKSLPGTSGIVSGNERKAAAVLSAGLVALAYGTATVLAQPPVAVGLIGIIGAVLAWANIARLSLAFYDDATGRVNSVTGPTQTRALTEVAQSPKGTRIV